MSAEQPAHASSPFPDEALTKAILSSPPFVPVEGVINFRDLGLAASLPLPPSNAPPTTQIRPGIVYRSGELTRLTPTGVTKLQELGIRAIFDFRSRSEVKKYAGQTPPLPPDSGIAIHTVPVSEKDEYDPGVLARRVAKFEKDEKEAFAELYEGIFENGRKAFGIVLRWIRDHPGEACLVHCTGEYLFSLVLFFMICCGRHVELSLCLLTDLSLIGLPDIHVSILRPGVRKQSRATIIVFCLAQRCAAD